MENTFLFKQSDLFACLHLAYAQGGKIIGGPQIFRTRSSCLCAQAVLRYYAQKRHVFRGEKLSEKTEHRCFYKWLV